ncbi:L,D-transpeptidase [Myxococcota bacterium]|nr:L,D-transpeptidase [Myxococcota bacterium]MBU1534166.1 L,D-transpeptidase [Myxococcota bacterium]
MRFVGAILWIFTAFQLSCAEAGAKKEHKQESDPLTTLQKVENGQVKPQCMADEGSTDYGPDKLKPTVWHAQSGIFNNLELPSLTKMPTLQEVRDAIEDGFRRIPRRGKWFKSLSFATPAKVYEKPDLNSLEMGRMEPQTRVSPVGYKKGTGCKGGWIRIALRGYVCLRNLKPARDLPTTTILPEAKDGALTPGQYAYVRIGGSPWYPSRGAVKAQKKGGDLAAGFFVSYKRFTRINGKNYWKTKKNQYIPVDRLARFIPSKHKGTDLTGELTLPILFPIAKNGAKGIAIPVYDKPGGTVVARLPYHRSVHIFGETKIGKSRFYRIGACRWVASRQVAAAFPSPIPPGVRPDEQWIDINLERQTLVAYEGSKPVFATIISTGKPGHSTRHGIFRVWWKIPEIDMKNEIGAKDEYLASAVPWTLFFWKGQALHGAYWHDDFGKTKSHGCVNLAPLDARYLYEWSRPYLGAGWRYQWTGASYPGITVQIRRDDEDRPMVWGIARNFIPTEQLAKLDTRYKKDIQKETLEMISAPTNQDGEALASGKGDKKSDNPPAPGEKSKKSVAKKRSKKRSTKKVARRKKRRSSAPSMSRSRRAHRPAKGRRARSASR